MTAEIAGVVKGNRGERRVRVELASGNQRLQIFSVMHYLEGAAELTIFLAYGIHAVGTGGDDEFWFDLVESGHILTGQLLIQKLIPRSPRAVAGTALLLAQNCKVHSRIVEQLDK